MNTEELNELKERVYKTSVKHGFYKDIKPDDYYLGLVMSEASEIINADQKERHADIKGFEEDISKGYPLSARFEWNIKDSVEEKIADLIIRLLDFAGMKGYTLYVGARAIYILDSNDASQKFEESGMPGMLFILMDILATSFDRDDRDELPFGISNVIYILSDCFKKMTGSDYDLWWFVKKKIDYNDLWSVLGSDK